MKSPKKPRERAKPHLVFGGELVSLEKHDFKDASEIDVVGVFPSYDAAHKAWKAAAQRTVDNAMMRYFVVDLERAIDDPDITVAGT